MRALRLRKCSNRSQLLTGRRCFCACLVLWRAECLSLVLVPSLALLYVSAQSCSDNSRMALRAAPCRVQRVHADCQPAAVRDRPAAPPAAACCAHPQQRRRARLLPGGALQTRGQAGRAVAPSVAGTARGARLAAPAGAVSPAGPAGGEPPSTPTPTPPPPPPPGSSALGGRVYRTALRLLSNLPLALAEMAALAALSSVGTIIEQNKARATRSCVHAALS